VKPVSNPWSLCTAPVGAQLQPIPPEFNPAVLRDTNRCNPYGIAAADVNSDGLPDLVVTHLPNDVACGGGGGTPTGLPCDDPTPSVVVFLNTGIWAEPPDPNVALVVHQIIPLLGLCGGADCQAREVALALMVGADVLPDIVIASGTGHVIVIPNMTGNPGTFGTPIVTPTPGNPRIRVNGLVVEDWNADGINDVGVAGLCEPKVVTMRGLGNGQFHPLDADVWTIPNVASDQEAFDLAAANFDTSTTGKDIVALIRENRRLGRMRNVSTLADIAFETSSFLPNYDPPWGFFQNIAAVKLDRPDNNWDLVTTRAQATRMDTYFGDGAGNFEHLNPRDTYIAKEIHPPDPVPDPNQATHEGLDVGRINDAGAYNDIVVTSTKGKDYVHIFCGRPGRDLDPDRDPLAPPPWNFRLEPPGTPQTSAEFPVHVIIVDLDDDGFNDLVTTNNASHNLSILINAMQ